MLLVLFVLVILLLIIMMLLLLLLDSSQVAICAVCSVLRHCRSWLEQGLHLLSHQTDAPVHSCLAL